MADKTSVLFQCSEEFKEALGIAANNAGLNLSEFVRKTLGTQIGYDFTKEISVDGRKRYANAEERREEQRKRQREERANVKLLIQIYKSEEHAETMKILRESIEKKEATT